MKSQLWSPTYLLLSLVNLFAWLSYNMITPILTGYSLSIGISLSAAGVVAGLFAMSSLFSRPLSGMLSDCFNRKRLNFLFTGIMTVSLLVYALVDQVWVLFLFRTIHGIAFGVSSTASLAIVSDIVPENRLAEGISYYGLSQIIAAAIGPGLGVWFSNAYGYRVCLVAGAALLMAATAAAGLMPYPPIKPVGIPKRTPAFKDFVERKVLVLSMVYCSHTIINGVVSTYLVALAGQRGIPGVNWHFTVNAATLFIVRIAASKATARTSLAWKIYLSGACFAVSMLLIWQAQSLWPLLLSGVFKAVGQGIGMPTVQTEAMQMVPPTRRGVAGSTIYIGGDLGQSMGSIAGGSVAQRMGYGNMYALSILPLVLTTGLFTGYYWNQNRSLQKRGKSDGTSGPR